VAPSLESGVKKTDMLFNYFKIALRGMMRTKAYTSINMFGLAVGVACCLVLALYMLDEFSFDKHHRHGDRLYRLSTTIESDREKANLSTTSAPIVWGIRDEVRELESVTRVLNPPGATQNLVRYEDNMFYESDGFLADSTFFDLFQYEFAEGDPTTALRTGNGVVISAAMAKKLFGGEPALNKSVRISLGGDEQDYLVTGVLHATQKPSHLKANFFIPMHSTGGWAEYLRSPEVQGEWAGQNFIHSYVRLKEGSDISTATASINKAFHKHGEDDMKATGMRKTLYLEPVSDLHLYATYGNQQPRIRYLYVIGGITLFILLVACVNFMNLSTARATKRANEVGLRKTMGAYRSSLVNQFLGEALLIVLFAVILSLVMVQAMLPFFNQLTGKELGFSSGNLLFTVGAIAVIAVVTGVAAGSYPAFYLSSFQPAQVLKGKLAAAQGNNTMRRALVVFQFVIAITLVSGLSMIVRQLNYMQHQDVGFQSDGKIVLPLRTEGARKNFESLRNELTKLSSVDDVSGTTYLPGSLILSDMPLYKRGEDMNKALRIVRNTVEPNYISLMKMKMISGREFSENRRTDSAKLIINEAAAKQYGFTAENIVGEKLSIDWQEKHYEFEVIGVMEDYHQTSLKNPIEPTAFTVAEKTENEDYMIVGLETSAFDGVLPAIESIWKKVNADTPFEYTFLDENLAKQYDEDKKVASMISVFTIIAMIISCMGLYGLSTFMAERRFKEIGVRKVMGATVVDLVKLMNTEFVILVVIAFALSVPIAWYFLNAWLEGFAYRAPLSIWIFIVSGAGALLIALFTVSFESFRAASGNPVKALRNE